MSEITKAIKLLCDEKGLSEEVVMETLEAALAAAFRKDFGNRQQNIKVKFDPETGDILVWDIKTVVEDVSEEDLEKAQEEMALRREKAIEEDRDLTEEEVADLPHFNPKTDLMITEAKEFKKKAKIGEELEIPLEVPREFGRMAAQTAKQVIIQKIREAERGMVFEDFKEQEGMVIVGTIQRAEAKKVLVDLGRITGVMPIEEQVRREFYRPGSRMKFFVVSVSMSTRGPEIILSRRDTALVREIFHQEIPEVSDNSIQIKGVARDAGFRSKVAVATDDNSIDPIGSCIGQRGGRINMIIEELNGEKIDVIKYSDDPEKYIINSLAPAKILKVNINEEEKTAEVHVDPDQFSLAIGRSGQNVRLASELTGWNLKVREEGTNNEVDSIELLEADKIEKTEDVVENVKVVEAIEETPVQPEVIEEAKESTEEIVEGVESKEQE